MQANWPTGGGVDVVDVVDEEVVVVVEVVVEVVEVVVLVVLVVGAVVAVVDAVIVDVDTMLALPTDGSVAGAAESVLAEQPAATRATAISGGTTTRSRRSATNGRLATHAVCQRPGRTVAQGRGHDGHVQVSITGFNLPGRAFCRPDGSLMRNVHVGVQDRREPAQLVPADASEARWDVDIDVVELEGELDFRGSVVQGKRGERFIYLTWGDVGPPHEFEMFRRAKLMLNRVDRDVMRSAVVAGRLVARIDLTGGDGGPRCARVDRPAIEWSVP